MNVVNVKIYLFMLKMSKKMEKSAWKKNFYPYIELIEQLLD